jgi:hypothetical protein
MDRHHRIRMAKNGEVPVELGYKWIGTTGQGWLKMERCLMSKVTNGRLKMERCLTNQVTNGVAQEE